MANEELIIERLDRIEAQLAPMVKAAKGMTELKEDVTPLLNLAVKQMIEELQDIESSFQLEDLLLLLKRLMRSTRNITFALNQLENVIDFVETVEPLMKSAVPQLINYLDDMEQRGVFRIIKATLDIRAKLATAYTAEDIDKIGDGVVTRHRSHQKNYRSTDNRPVGKACRSAGATRFDRYQGCRSFRLTRRAFRQGSKTRVGCNVGIDQGAWQVEAKWS